MVLIIILISLWFYLKYFTKNFDDAKETQVIEKIDENQNSTSTYIDDINYVSTDTKGNRYQITAKQAEIKVENSDVMFLRSVVAFIYIKDSDTVKITSNFGKYNILTYDTIFSKNVIIRYLDNKINWEYVDFSIARNSMIVTKDIVYTNINNILKADVMEMNLTTKDVKIFMHSENNKVNIKNINWLWASLKNLE